MTNCTCPSGDGSLRWPCPAHPPTPAAAIDEILKALDLARGQIDGAETAPAFYNFDYLTGVMQMARELKQPTDVSVEPVAEVAESFIFVLRHQDNGDRWPVGTKLYASPVAAPVSTEPVAWWDKLISLIVNYGDCRHFEVEAVDKRDAVCNTTQAFADLTGHIRRATVAAQAQQSVSGDHIAGAGNMINQDANKADAERYRFIRSKVTASNATGKESWSFHYESLPTPLSNPMKGSVAGHFDDAIDAARKERQ